MLLKRPGYVAIAILVALQTAGCLSVSELRQKIPIREFSAATAPSALSDCILAEMTALDRDNTYRRTFTGDTIHITADQGDPRLALLDIAISSAGQGSHVELRARGNIWGSTNEPDETATIIVGCASH